MLKHQAPRGWLASNELTVLSRRALRLGTLTSEGGGAAGSHSGRRNSRQLAEPGNT